MAYANDFEPPGWGQPTVAEWPPDAKAKPRRRRRLRRMLLIGLVVEVVVLGAADRGAAHVAASRMANQVQKSQHLPTRPKASAGGIPFLTQVMTGKYKNIGIDIHRVAVSNVCVDDVDVHLKGVHVPLRKMIRNDLKTVPVDRLVGSVRLTSGDLNAYLDTQPGHVQLAPAGQGMRVSAPVDVPAVGRVTVFGDVRASVHNNGLTLAPAGIGANGASALTIPSGAMKTLTTTIPLSGLPMNLRLVSAKVTPSGIQATAEVDHLTLDTTQTAPALRAC